MNDTRLQSIERDLKELEEFRKNSPERELRELRTAVRLANWRLSGILTGDTCCAAGGAAALSGYTAKLALRELPGCADPEDHRKKARAARLLKDTLLYRNRKKLREILTNVGVQCTFKTRPSGEYVTVTFGLSQMPASSAMIGQYIMQVWPNSHVTSYGFGTGTFRLLP